MSQFSVGNKSPSPPSSPTTANDVASEYPHLSKRDPSAVAQPEPLHLLHQKEQQDQQQDQQQHQQQHNGPPVSYRRPATPPSRPDYGPSVDASPSPANSPQSYTKGHHRRTSSRPLSMIGGYQPPIMDVGEDTIPELQPIFTFLNSHSNKLYQEGYFLKLDDQNSRMSLFLADIVRRLTRSRGQA